MTDTRDTGLGREASFIPEYQEMFLKDLLANVYQTQLDADGNPLLDANGQPIVTGIAADSPLFGTPVLDADGNQMFEIDPNTGQQRLDFRGQPIPMVEGGVRRPDVAPMTPNQLEAVRLAEEGVGAFSPMFDQAQAAFGGFEFNADGSVKTDSMGQPIRSGAIGQVGKGASALGQGITTVEGTTGLYDTDTRRGAADPIFSDYSQDVIGGTSADIDTARRDLSGAGAFGLGAAAEGIGRLDSTTGAFDPQGIGSFMNQYEDAAVQQAIQDIARAGQQQRNELGAQAVGAGAFGGSREAIAQAELGRNILEQQGRTAAGMRQAGFESAAQRAQAAFEDQQGRGQSAAQLQGQLGQAGASTAMDAAGSSANLAMGLSGLRGTGFEMAQNLGQSAFEDQMQRGQNASQIFGSLGQGLGSLASQQTDIGTRQAALGEAAQQAGQSDVNALFNIGGLEQGQMQSEYDVQRQADIEEAYEPYQRFNYMSDIFRGVPSQQSSLSVASKPMPSPVSTVLGMTQGLQNYRNAGGGGIFG